MLALAPHHVLPIEVQLSSLRSGDVITYCFRSKPWCLFPTNDPLYAVQAAIERGVLLDVGHGSEAFDGDTAQRAIKSGVLPHIVSSGIKREESGQPKPLLLARVMQRLAAMGMSMSSLIRAVTITPASVLGLTDGSGTFRLGGRADMTALNTAHSHWAANAVMANGFPVISSGPKIGIR
jgi:dihydroorotase